MHCLLFTPQPNYSFVNCWHLGSARASDYQYWCFVPNKQIKQGLAAQKDNKSGAVGHLDTSDINGNANFIQPNQRF